MADAGRWGGTTVALFALMVLSWAGNYLFVRLGEQSAAPLALATYRAALGAAGVGAYLAWRAPGASLPPRDRRDAFLLGIPNTGLFLGLWFVAAPAIAPGETSVLIYTFPLWVALFSPAVLGLKLGRSHWAAVAIGFAGVALISEPWNGGLTRSDLLPIAELLGAAITWAATTTLFQRRFEPAALARANGYQLLGGAVALAAASFAAGELFRPTPTADLAVSVLWLGLFGTAFAYGVWFFLLQKLHASTLSAYSFLVPLVTLALSAGLEHEHLGTVELAGVALVVLGVYLVGRRPLAAPPARRAAPGVEPG